MDGKSSIILFNVISVVFAQGVSFLIEPFFAKVLGSEKYGIVAIFITWATIFSTVYSLQAGEIIGIAKSDYPPEEQSGIQSSVLFLAVFSYLFFSVITLIVLYVANIFLTSKLNLLLCTMSLFYGLGLYCVSFYNTFNVFEFNAKTNMIIAFVVVFLSISLSLLFILLVPREENYYGRVLGLTVSYLILTVYVAVRIYNRGRLVFNPEYWKYSLAYGIPTIFHLLAGILLANCDKLMIQRMLGNSETGIYSLAAGFSAVVYYIYMALNKSWVPFLYAYIRENNFKALKIGSQNCMELFSVIVAGFILLSKEVYHIYAPKEFWEGAIYITVLSIGYFFVFLYSFPVNFEFYHKKTKIVAVATGIAAICNLFLNYILIRALSEFGAAIATMIAYIIQFLIHYMFASKMCKNEFFISFKTFFKYIVFVMVVVIVSFVFEKEWYIRWFIGAVLGLWIVMRMIKRRSVF